MKILILTKTAYISRLKQVLPKCKFGTIHNESKWINEKWDFIISYCYGRMVKGDILKQEIYNLHPAPLPEYAGGDPYARGAEDQVLKWAVTIHKMTEEYDKGDIVLKHNFILEDAPDKHELWIISHTYAINLLIDFIQSLVCMKSEKSNYQILKKAI